ncbi:MAG: hypothetical protein L6Q99_17275 [Planctomycetes bacterium]|nr:hypothetical protein [Planctomycetota bacterium]
MSSRRWCLAIVSLTCCTACATAPNVERATWRYALSFAEPQAASNGGPRPLVFALELRAPAGPALELGVDPRTASFTSSTSLAFDGEHWRLPASNRERRATWRFDAGAAARTLDDGDVAALRAGAFVGSLSSLLPHPSDDVAAGEFELVSSFAGATFVAAADRGELAAVGRGIACALVETAPATLRLDDGRDWTTDPELVLVPLAPLDVLTFGEVARWSERSVRLVADALARDGVFPFERVPLFLVPRAEPGVGPGHALAGGAPSIWIEVGARTPPAAFDEDWVLVHELVHLVLPSVAPAQRWFDEGSATYLEPQLRARAGLLDERVAWRAVLDEYAQGLPSAERTSGLDGSTEWGRVYYGGALFCLLADVELRERTQGRSSLIAAWRAVATELGPATRTTTVAEIVAVGDRATDTDVLSRAYAASAIALEPRDLEALWARLGVARDGDGVRFDDRAELAAVRRALFARAPETPP